MPTPGRAKEVRRVEYMPLDEVPSATRNPKLHSGDIPVSMRRFGFTEPLLLDERTQRLVAGHGRLEALRHLRAAKEGPPPGVQVKKGQWLVPVVRGWASRSDTEADAYLVASNRLTEAGGWENTGLAELLQELQGAQALEGTGFSDADLSALLSSLEPPTVPAEPPAGGEGDAPLEEEDVLPPVPEKPWVKLGDVFTLGRHRLMCGDSTKDLGELLQGELAAAVLTDPPYELGFMGKAWDSSGVAFSLEFWRGIQQHMKPGAHLLAFGATRTYHRMACAIEDAGLEIRDSVHWVYGQGFPKSLDVSKAIDASAGAEREVTPTVPMQKKGEVGEISKNRRCALCGKARASGNPCTCARLEDVPATEAAKQWEGWGTALKPSHEPAVLARKPLEGTVAENVLEHGTGALNIDGGRIGTEVVGWGGGAAGGNTWNEGNTGLAKDGEARPVEGRWPANAMFDEAAAAELDAQSGVLTSGKLPAGTTRKAKGAHVYDLGMDAPGRVAAMRDFGGDSGGASRFFYVAKPSRAERGETNNHATVKPLALMRHLATLIGPPGGIVLEPFAGSGTTLLACEQLGLTCYALELSPAHTQIVIERWEALTKQKVPRPGGEV